MATIDSAVFILISFALCVSGNEETKTIQTNDGPVRGLHTTTLFNNVHYYAFKGIPYAKPPIGDLRFKVCANTTQLWCYLFVCGCRDNNRIPNCFHQAPEPIESWTPNVLDTFNYSNICIQPIEFSEDPNPQHEDCLYLNVFIPGKSHGLSNFVLLFHDNICIGRCYCNTPCDIPYIGLHCLADVKPNAKLAVMFFIHGGGYAEGSGNDNVYGADFLIEKDVVLVTINYRIGILGFLSLAQPEYSGNMGLKDQQLALKWAYENVEHFGGDQNRITIFGQSAGNSLHTCPICLYWIRIHIYSNCSFIYKGSAATHHQVLSAESRKYFRNAIVMSGSAVHYWGISSLPNHIDLAVEMTSSWGVPKTHLNEIIDVLKSVPAEKFVEFSRLASTIQRTFAIPNGPVVESKGLRCLTILFACISNFPSWTIFVSICFYFPFERNNDSSHWTHTTQSQMPLDRLCFNRQQLRTTTTIVTLMLCSE